MSCQRRSMKRGSSPMSRPATGARRSRVPPSPMPVIPASVSTVTTMSDWLKSGLGLGGDQTRTRVIFILGRPAAVADGAAAVADVADAAASERRKERRCMTINLSDRRSRCLWRQNVRSAGPAVGALLVERDELDRVHVQDQDMDAVGW